MDKFPLKPKVPNSTAHLGVSKLQRVVLYLEKLDIKLKIKVNGRKMPFIVVLIVFLLGVKSLL